MPELVESQVHANGKTFVLLSQILLQQAIIDTEERVYYTNSGISFEGMERSFLIDLNERNIRRVLVALKRNNWLDSFS